MWQASETFDSWNYCSSRKEQILQSCGTDVNNCQIQVEEEIVEKIVVELHITVKLNATFPLTSPSYW